MMKKLTLGLIAGLSLIWLLGGLYFGATTVLGAADNPVTVSPADVGLDYEEVQIESDGLSLPGWWMPHSSPRGVLVWAHGGGSNRHSTFWDSLGFYKALHDRGISVLTFDQRDHGDAPRDTGKITLGKDESRDVAAAVGWAREKAGRSQPLFLMGVSMGGASSILAVADGLQVDALLLTDPELSAEDVLNQGGWVATGIPGPLFNSITWGAVLFQNIPSGDRSPLTLAKQLTLPTLILQSPDDPVTRAPFARELAADNTYVKLVEAPPVDADDPCINFKGRWGSHASAYLCHPEWTMANLDAFLTPWLGATP